MKNIERFMGVGIILMFTLFYTLWTLPVIFILGILIYRALRREERRHDRFLMYCRMLVYMENLPENRCICFCSLIITLDMRARKRLRKEFLNLEKQYPELWHKRPKGARANTVWFNINKLGRQQRIDILKQIIKEMEI